jgi:hypothetical protein
MKRRGLNMSYSKVVTLKNIIGDKFSLLDPFLFEDAKVKISELTEVEPLPQEEMDLFLKESLGTIEKYHDAYEVPEEEVDEVDDMSFEEFEVASDDDESVDYSKIATELLEQDPQLVAFFIAKLEDEKKEALLSNLPEHFTEKVQTLRVENLVFSESLYDKLYHRFFQ